MNLRNRLKSNSLGARIRRDRISDIRELIEIEQRQWGPRMRLVGSLGEPTAGLGFAGVVVPNNEPVASPASTTSTTETCLYTLASTGASTWMFIPAGNFRAPQSWRIWAGGIFTTTATTQTFTWTTRLGTSTTPATNASFPVATGALNPPATITSGLWWYEAHMTVRSPGTAGTVMGTFEADMGNAAAATNTVTGLGGTGSATIALDTTQGAFWCIDVANSTTSAAIQLTQFMIAAWD